MKKLSASLALLALPALFATACGGDLFDLPDSGTGACPSGVVPNQIKTGIYKATNVKVISETCNLGVTAADISGDRKITNDANGNITLQSADSATILGTGPVRCNKGTLSFGPTTLANSSCQYAASSLTDFTSTGANTFDAIITQDRANSMQVSMGPTCKQPIGQSCTVKYSMTLTWSSL